MIACLLKLVCSIMLIAGARTVSQKLIIFISAFLVFLCWNNYKKGTETWKICRIITIIIEKRVESKIFHLCYCTFTKKLQKVPKGIV
jgi:hypothetical protein